MFGFFRTHLAGRSPQAAPGLGFSLDLSGGKPTFLLCGNLLSLDRGNGFAQAFIFPGWFVPSGSRSDRAGPGLGRGMWGCMIHSYVIGRGNTATAYLQAGMIRPVPDATADAVVDVQVQRTGGESRLKDEEVVLFFLAEKRAERTCGEEKMATPGWTEKKRSSALLRRGSVPQKIYWEGNILNKISKKIVSAVTMGAFALTLIPAAAFAADIDSTVGASAEFANGTQSANVVVNSTLDLSVNVGSEDLGGDGGTQIGFWAAEEDTKTPVGDVDFVDAADNPLKDYGANSSMPNMEFLQNASADSTDVPVKAKFDSTDAGKTFDIYAAYFTGSETQQDLIDEAAYIGTVNVYPAASLDNDDIYMSIKDSANNTADVTVGEAEPVNYSITADGAAAMMPDGQEVYLWASTNDSSARPVDVIDVANATEVTDIAGVYALNDPATEAAQVTFTEDGSYTLWLGYGPATLTSAAQLHTLQSITINATNPAVVTSLITFDADQADGSVVRTNSVDRTSEWLYIIDDEVIPNNVKTYTITGVAYQADGSVAANETLTLSENEDDFSIVGENTVTTNDQGVFSVNVKIDDPGEYDLVVANLEDNVRATLTIRTNNVAPDTIETTKDGGVLLAGNDINYIDNAVESFADAIQFSITDTYGHEQTGNAVLAGEVAHDYDADRSAYIDVTNAPEDSTLGADNLVLAWDGSAYTLLYDGASPATDLIAGEYTVEVSLNNGKKAVADFTVANFGEIEELTLDLTAEWRNDTTAKNDSITVLDEQVALGQRVIVEPMYVDANGLKIKADDVVLTAEGAAVESRHLSGAYRYFDLFWNIPSNQSLIGTVVTVQAYDETNHNYVERELTVVDAYQNETLAFDPTQGEVGESNTVNVTVEANDAISKVNGTMSAYIASQSNEEATIDLDVQKNVVNGEGKLFLQSDAEGTVDVVVAVKANNGEIYANTLTFTFGDEDPYAGSYIVMTIGSDQYLINGEMFDGSVDNLGAPYVDSAWRTMVPVRVLAESFGANVDYADNVVTIVDGDTTVVMNIGEETYTVNGEEKAMDTAAVIGDDDRTYVPVRFVAEALGYSVTPLYDANGLTSSVHFSK